MLEGMFVFIGIAVLFLLSLWLVIGVSLSFTTLFASGLAGFILLLAVMLLVIDLLFGAMGFAILAGCILLAWALSDMAAQGVLTLPVTGIGLWAIIMAPGLLASLLGFFMWRKSVNAPVTTGTEAMVGQPLIVQSWQNNSGKGLVHGEIWIIEPEHADMSFLKGDEAIVVARNGLTLTIKPAQ